MHCDPFIEQSSLWPGRPPSVAPDAHLASGAVARGCRALHPRS